MDRRGNVARGDSMKGVPYTVRGLTLECEFEFEAGEPQTLDDPGWPDIYTLTGAWLDGVNVTAIIDPAIVQELEERARWP
jgi:hypothetical protein